MVWDSFETGTPSELIAGNSAVFGTWGSGAGSEVPVYSREIPHSGIGCAAIRNTGSLCQNTTFGRLYMDFWLFIDYDVNKSRNYKPWRFYGENDNLQLNYVWYCSGQSMTYFHGPSLSVNDWHGIGYDNQNWYHFQLEYLESDPGQANGRVRQWINGVISNDYTGITRMTDVHFNQIRVGHYWARDGVEGCPINPGANLYFDDVYIDNTWTRSEIGDSPVYSQCSHKEIQIPLAWSDGIVTIQVNQGSFGPGDEVYLFVMNQDGVMNPTGLSLTLGAPTENINYPGPPPVPDFGE